MSEKTPWANNWVIKEELGRGGQGVVSLLGSIKEPNQFAVLKEIVPRWREDPQAKARLEKEAQTLAALNACNARVPTIYESSIGHEQSEPYILMEFIEGTRFDKWLSECAPATLDEALQITKSIAETISNCHTLNIGHRDLKPANIILRNGDVALPYVIDFGISFDSRQTFILTNNGEMFWNEFLILPECQDLEGGHRDLRSDITALVGVFFACLTGKPPVVLRNAYDQAPHQRHEELVLQAAPTREIGERLLWFFTRGFSVRLTGRFQSMEEFLSELNHFESRAPKLKLDLTEEFRLFNRGLIQGDRNVQLDLLEKTYSAIRTRILDDAHRKTGGVTSAGGKVELRKVSLSKLPVDSRLKFEGNLLSQDNIHFIELSRHQYNKMPFAALAGVANGMNIEIHVSSGIRLNDASQKFERPLSWQKIVVMNEDSGRLSDAQHAIVVDSLIDGLATEVSRLGRILGASSSDL